jgi:hypothetical protein
MSKPDNAVALDEFPDEEVVDTAATTENTFESEVNDALKSMVRGEDGKMKFPDGLREEVLVAANAERRRRDTESELSKERAKTKVLSEKVNKFVDRIADGLEPTLTVEQKEELEDLKRDDPDAWREKLNKYEEDARTKLEEELELDEEDVAVVSEVERRAELLQEFNEANPELVLNDEVFENDLPPRITGKLAKGEITFEEFLVEAKKFLEKSTTPVGKNVKIKTNVEDQGPNLGKAGGGSKAQDTAVEGDIVKSYKSEIF